MRGRGDDQPRIVFEILSLGSEVGGPAREPNRVQYATASLERNAAPSSAIPRPRIAKNRRPESECKDRCSWFERGAFFELGSAPAPHEAERLGFWVAIQRSSSFDRPPKERRTSLNVLLTSSGEGQLEDMVESWDSSFLAALRFGGGSSGLKPKAAWWTVSSLWSWPALRWLPHFEAAIIPIRSSTIAVRG